MLSPKWPRNERHSYFTDHYTMLTSGTGLRLWAGPADTVTAGSPSDRQATKQNKEAVHRGKGEISARRSTSETAGIGESRRSRRFPPSQSRPSEHHFGASSVIASSLRCRGAQLDHLATVERQSGQGERKQHPPAWHPRARQRLRELEWRRR